MIGLVVVTDGRVDYLAQAIESAEKHLTGVESRVIVNDEGTSESHAYLRDTYPDWKVKSHPTRRGLAGAVQTAWGYAKAEGWSHLFHLEEDFVLERPVDASELAGVLRRCPSLAQIVLKRQAWSPDEVRAGGIVECSPNGYHEKYLGNAFLTVHEPTGMPHVFSLNPCLIPRRVFSLGWPESNEAGMTERVAACGWRLALWGRKFSSPVVTHIGVRRSAGWAL